MPLAALLLVLGAALCHSAWNLLVKTDARRLEIQSGALIVGVLLCSPVLLIYSLADVSRLAWGVIFVSGLFETAYVFGLDAALIHLVRWVRGGLTLPLGRDAPWGRTVAVGVLMMAAYLAVLAAMAMAPVSYVVAAREVSIVVTAVLGVLVLRERHSAARIAGAAVIFAGLVVIALAR